MNKSKLIHKEIRLPPKLKPVFDGEARIRGAYGGRGSGKTRSFALMTAIRGYIWGSKEKRVGQIVCGRQYQNSLAESSFEEIKTAIKSIDYLDEYYECGERYIRSRDGRITYSFIGLEKSLGSIKSKSRILLAWVDEAEFCSAKAYDLLLPTVREVDSEVWLTWNPETKYSATHERFRENPPPGSKIVQMNYMDNPWFPEVLELQRLDDKKNRPDTYEHIWLGEFLTYSEGSYYGKEMRKVREEERIARVPYDTGKGVITSWDLGVGDSTSIVFAQYIGTEVHIIDYYEANGVGLEHYAKVLQDKGYVYERHILPHDVRVRELGSGMSRLETLADLGIRDVDIAPQLPVDDGIQAARTMFDKCWFDEKKTEKLIDCLINYSRDYDEIHKVFKVRPRHDWASHGADAFRYLAIGYKPYNTTWSEPIRRNLAGVV